MRLWTVGLIGVGCLLLSNFTLADDGADDTFFEVKVRPILIAKCLECHGSEKPKAGLKLDSRQGILNGGESGPAAVVVTSEKPDAQNRFVGKPEESLLIDVISYRNTVQMPPKSKLPDSEIAILTEWVRRGLPWPNSTPVNPSETNAGLPAKEFSEDQKTFWAFQPVKRLEPPNVEMNTWVRSPIDRFILAKLESKSLAVSPEADRRTLIRRTTLDLIGLLPLPNEVEDFVSDASPDALERVVDRLLASPRYGERWARHWLDVARYADSNGLDENLAYANAFRYRDYVVRAMNEDKPYDQFLLEQIAGDLIEAEAVADLNSDKNDLEARSSQSQPNFDRIIATGFLCLGAKMLAEDDPVKMQMDIIDEQVDTISRAVLGLTMGCARCHDHKYDPLTMEDYYGLAGIFKSTQTMDTYSVVARWHERPLATGDQLRARDELQQRVTNQKQAIDKIKEDATESIMAEARKHAGAYLLAATREWQLAEQLSSAKPRGNALDPSAIPGAILIEAEDYGRGNVLKDRDNYGKDIGVLVNRGETPNFTEYDVNVAETGIYQFELRYAAAGSRPVRVFVNGELAKSDAANKVTGSWTPETQTWFVECFVTLKPGQNLIRLEQPQFFPHIDKLLLTPSEQAKLLPANTLLSAAQSNSPRLIPAIIEQWVKLLETSRNNSKSILTAWHPFVGTHHLVADPTAPENGVVRLAGSAPPKSLNELASRYDDVFATAQLAWLKLKSSSEGKEAQSLPEADLEEFRKLLTDPKGPLAAPSDLESHFAIEIVAQLKAAREELSLREASVPRFAETMAVSDSKAENLKIHLRGSHLTLGREVTRRFPQIFSMVGQQETESSGIEMTSTLQHQSGRLPLARWLVKPDHPLTSRVMVNRIWQWHFGQGLVRSPDNFGRLGERPSHPELLDWLACEFSGQIDAGNSSPRAWSLKTAHRSMIASATYRQNTNIQPAAVLADPENRLLWRSHRQRMEVEVLRDSLLWISGQLDEIPGGSMLPTPNRNYVTSTANVNPAVYNSNRRSIYLPVVRSALYEVFTAFDFADPSTLAGQRDQTTVAPQALFMMNSAFVLDQVRSLAREIHAIPVSDTSARIRFLYQRAYSRGPSEAEVSRLTGYLDRLRSAMANSGIAETEIETRVWVSMCRAVLSANEFVYVD